MLKNTHITQCLNVYVSKYLGYPVGHYLSPDGWYCNKVHASTLGLPLSLKNVEEDLDYELFHEGNLYAISEAEIDEVLVL